MPNVSDGEPVMYNTHTMALEHRDECLDELRLALSERRVSRASKPASRRCARPAAGRADGVVRES